MLAVADPEEAATSVIGRAVAAAPDGLFGWAVAVDDVPAQAQRLGLEVTSIERDGLTARLTGVAAGHGRALAAVLHPARPGHRGSRRDRRRRRHRVDRAGGATPSACTSGWAAARSCRVRYAAGEAPGLRAVGLGSGAVIR